MTDVFIRTRSNNDWLRYSMFSLTDARWGLEPVVIHVYNTGHIVPIRELRMKAEQEATSDPYIFTDDDVLIVGKDWVKRSVEALLSNPRYGAVSSLSLVESENLAVCPAEYKDQAIYPMHAVGAPMIIRKGLMVDLPEMDLNSECGVIFQYLLGKGYSEGLVTGLRHNHLGHGFSSNPALFWGY